MLDNHDSHYRAIEKHGVEPIAVMESIVCNGLPEEHHSTAKRNLNLALAAKYLVRCGHKGAGSDDMEKAANYIHRAIHGAFRT